MRKNGFTLIELLAVIVILAIIALIAVPIVLNIIEDSKKSSQKESINMYAKAIEDGVANYFLKNPGKKEIPTLTQLEREKYINYSGDEVKCEETRIYKSGKIYLGKCSVAGEQVTYTYGEKEKTLCTLVKKNGNKDINIGDEYTCEVIKGMENPFTFYVLTEPKNEKVNLIMNSNICNDGTIPTSEKPCTYAWHWQTQEDDENDNRYGPDIAMTNLYNGTKMWNNVPDMIMSYEDENNKNDTTKGYQTITTDETTKVTTITGNQNTPTQYQTFGNTTQPLKARLPREDEVFKENDDNYCNYNGGSCPTWLVENLYLDNAVPWCSTCQTKYANTPKISNISGYWLLSSHPGASYAARIVYFDGSVSYDGTSNAGSGGVRAVITVSKSDLS